MNQRQVLTLLRWLRRLHRDLADTTLYQLFMAAYFFYHKKLDVVKIAQDVIVLAKFNEAPYYLVNFTHKELYQHFIVKGEPSELHVEIP